MGFQAPTNLDYANLAMSALLNGINLVYLLLSFMVSMLFGLYVIKGKYRVFGSVLLSGLVTLGIAWYLINSYISNVRF